MKRLIVFVLIVLLPAAMISAEEVLTFDDAVKTAFEHSAEIKKGMSDVLKAKAIVEKTYAMFDVQTSAGVTYTESKDEVTQTGAPEETKVLAYNAGLARKMETAGTLSIDLTSARTQLFYPETSGGLMPDMSFIPSGGEWIVPFMGSMFGSAFTPVYNPSYSPELTLSYRQPLLKDFWGRPDQVAINIGDYSVRLAKQGFKEKLTGMVKNLRDFFALVYMSEKMVEINKDALKDTEKFYNQALKLKKIGLREDKDIYQTKASMLSAKAEINPAENNFAMAKENLLNQIGIPAEKWDVIKLETAEVVEDVYIPEELTRDLEDTYVDLQPQVEIARLSYEMAKMNKRISENAGLPDLSLIGSYGLKGTSDDLGVAYDRMTSNDFHNFTIGAQLTFALPNRGGSGDNKEKQEEMNKAQEDFEFLKRQTKIMIRDGYRKLVSAKNDFELKKEASGLLKKRLAIEIRNFNQGRISTQQLLMAQTDYHIARIKEVSSFYSYTQAVSNWNKITGKYDGYYNDYLKDKEM